MTMAKARETAAPPCPPFETVMIVAPPRVQGPEYEDVTVGVPCSNPGF